MNNPIIDFITVSFVAIVFGGLLGFVITSTSHLLNHRNDVKIMNQVNQTYTKEES